MGKGPSGPGSWAPMAHLPTVALLLLGASGTAWDICSSPGDLPAPELFLNTSQAQEGEQVSFRCSIEHQGPATRIYLCKDGVEKNIQEAQQGKRSYFFLLDVTLGSAGTYTCGYQRKKASTWEGSALSKPQNLTVTGSESSSQSGPSTTAVNSPTPSTPKVYPFPTAIVLGVVAISLLLLAVATYCAVKKVSSPSPETGIPPTAPVIPLWIWILRSALTLLLLTSAPIITLILERCSPCAARAGQPVDIPVPIVI